MASFQPPVRDYRFLLEEVHAGELQSIPGYEDLSDDLVSAILEEASRFASEVLAPLNRSADEEGCRLEAGSVRTPTGFVDAYRQFRKGGWASIDAATEHGGQGLPRLLNFIVLDFFFGANLAFAVYPSLSHGAYTALHKHANDDVQALFLPKMAQGAWTGTMCLTEPHCGTDLGLMRTKAEPDGRGTYKVSGTKIFISGGDHDLTENIVHLVLAKLPDAPPGVKGISMFAVPKRLPAESGAGETNGVVCGAVEHKMGIKASATCVLNFEGATGWLVGEPHQGLRAMFTMMNAARLGVAMQGAGVAEASLQRAISYSKERLQGKALETHNEVNPGPDPIIVHPDIRKNLMIMRSFVEGARALSVWLALQVEISERDPDPERREVAEDLLALLTPVVKAYFTDMGTTACNLGMQIFGGHGFIRDNGMEQFVRDVRITQIYEGANGIQALDLIGRKLPMHGGRLYKTWLSVLRQDISAVADEALKTLATELSDAIEILEKSTSQVVSRGLANPAEAAAVSSDYLRMMALIAVGHAWLRSANAAVRHQSESDFYVNKLKTAQFYFTHLLPEIHYLSRTISSGAGSVMAIEPDQWH